MPLWIWKCNLRYRKIRVHFSVKFLHSTERNASLCRRHQNISLKLRALKSVKNMRIINNNVTKMSLKKLFIKEFNEFQQHVQRVRNHYEEPMILKTVWRSTHVFAQMEFAKDYICSDEFKTCNHPRFSNKIILLSNKAEGFVVWTYDADRKMPRQTSGNWLRRWKSFIKSFVLLSFQ